MCKKGRKNDLFFLTGAVDIYWFITERFTKFMHQVPEFLQNNVNIKKVKKVIMPITGC